MNANLSETMSERARLAEDGPIDLDSVIRAGDRRRRIRAVTTTGVAVAAVAAIAVGGVALLPDDGQPVIAASRSTPSYATGSTIHLGDRAIDVGDHTIHSYVRTERGFVFSDENDDVYFADGASVEKIGSGVVREGNLRSQDGGSYVAWVDNGADTPEFVVYDTESMTEVLRTSEGNDVNRGPNFETNPASIVSIDGDDVYVINGGGLARVDVATGSSEQIKTGGVSEFDVMDARNGLILHKRPGTYWDGNAKRILGHDYSSEGTRLPAHTEDLSPDGQYAVGTTGSYDPPTRLRVVNTESGEVTQLRSPEYRWLVRPMWLDARTVLADGRNRHAPNDLVTCDIVTGDCKTVAAGMGDFGNYQLPDGQFESDAGL